MVRVSAEVNLVGLPLCSWTENSNIAKIQEEQIRPLNQNAPLLQLQNVQPLWGAKPQKSRLLVGRSTATSKFHDTMAEWTTNRITFLLVSWIVAYEKNFIHSNVKKVFMRQIFQKHVMSQVFAYFRNYTKKIRNRVYYSNFFFQFETDTTWVMKRIITV